MDPRGRHQHRKRVFSLPFNAFGLSSPSSNTDSPSDGTQINLTKNFILNNAEVFDRTLFNGIVNAIVISCHTHGLARLYQMYTAISCRTHVNLSPPNQ